MARGTGIVSRPGSCGGGLSLNVFFSFLFTESHTWMQPVSNSREVDFLLISLVPPHTCE